MKKEDVYNGKRQGKKSVFMNFIDNFSSIITDRERCDRVLHLGAYVLLGLISLGMSFLNVGTNKGFLTFVTFLFAGLCLINFLVTFFLKKSQKFISYVFEFEFLFMFVYFIISGVPDGFSAIWTALLPLSAMLLFGLLRGTSISSVMLVVLLFFFYTPVGKNLLMYDYNETFLMRFPLLYIAFMAVAFMFAYINHRMYDAYEFASTHDPLTGAYNRRGFLEYAKKQVANGNYTNVGFIIFDLDKFKHTNDTYGHFNGDIVLSTCHKNAKEVCPYPICRWGGEEFAVFVPNGDETEAIADAIHKSCLDAKIKLNTGEEIIQTISVGAIRAAHFISLDKMTIQADECLYESKNNGRNLMTYKEV